MGIWVVAALSALGLCLLLELHGRMNKMPTIADLKSAVQDALNAQTAKFLAALEKEKEDVVAAIKAAIETSHPLTDADKDEILEMVNSFGNSIAKGVDTIQPPVEDDPPIV